MPKNSCDCHHHIYDRRFPYAAGDTRALPDATVADYRRFKQWLGHTRHVLVQPSSYGTDNRCLVSALKAFGPTARGEAVVDDTVTDAALDALAGAGVTGVRFNLAAGHATSAAMLLPVARRVTERGWHVQVHATADQLWALRPLLLQIPGRLVIDHAFRLPQPDPMAHPCWRLAWTLLERGRCWVKLSAPYQQSQREDYADMAPVMARFLSQATERVLWGSDWPHPSLISANRAMPDDAFILSALCRWAHNDQVRHRLLVANPAELYRFD